MISRSSSGQRVWTTQTLDSVPICEVATASAGKPATVSDVLCSTYPVTHPCGLQ
jgi:hypothetical protein